MKNFFKRFMDLNERNENITIIIKVIIYLFLVSWQIFLELKSFFLATHQFLGRWHKI